MRDERVYLEDILEALDDIRSFTEGGKGVFETSREKQYAVLRCFEIIGEAAKSVSDSLKAQYPDVPWKQMAGMRDKLMHEYFGVSLERVWDAAERDLPPLREQIEQILCDLGPGPA